MGKARVASQYLKLLQSLLPKGYAWNRDEDSDIGQFLYGEAGEFARVEGRAYDLLQERDTRYASELLIDHETDLGLPDECSPDGQTIQERRLAAHTKLISLGGQNPAYFIELAEAYGWEVTIEEFSPFICGAHGAYDRCGESLSIFWWSVTITIGGGNLIHFLCGSSECGDSLGFLGDVDSMICIFNKYKPAHTSLVWGFNGPEFNIEFDSAFDAMPASIGSYLDGAFSYAFGLGFDVNLGGGFSADSFTDAFRKPAYFGYDTDPLPTDLSGAFSKDFGTGFYVRQGGDFAYDTFTNDFDKSSYFEPWVFDRGFDTSFTTFYSENPI